jgi:WXXGXW repeat (2 copies)
MKTGTRLPFVLIVLIGTLLVLGSCNRNSGTVAANDNLAPLPENAPAAAPYGQAPNAQAPSAPAPAPVPETQYGEQLTYAPQPPPPLPVYTQPPCPGENYIWTPGYWSYGEVGYYWVPGVWVLAPYVDALWTPPYWDYYDGRYRWHHGYWSRYIGFYGGINYGFGYTGLGYNGGYWAVNGAFVYNREVNNVNPRVAHYIYRHSVPNYTPFNRISFNGPGGINRAATPRELAVGRQVRFDPVPAQVQHMRSAAMDRAQLAVVNRGRPATVAVPHALSTPYRAPGPAPRSWEVAHQNVPTFKERPGGGPPARAQAVPGQIPRPEMHPGQPPQVARPAPPQLAIRGSQARPGQPGLRFGGPPPKPPRPAPQEAQQAHPTPPAPRFAAPPQRPAPQVAQHPHPAPPPPRFGEASRTIGPPPATHARPAPPPRPAPQPAPHASPESHPGPPAAGEQHHRG